MLIVVAPERTLRWNFDFCELTINGFLTCTCTCSLRTRLTDYARNCIIFHDGIRVRPYSACMIGVEYFRETIFCDLVRQRL